MSQEQNIDDKNDQYLIKNSNQFRRKLFEKLHGISSKFKIDYSINPNLKYEYPELNPIILENILNALIACPRFYIQTLHLMNKMNLPCPLVNYIRTQRPLQFQNIDLSINNLSNSNNNNNNNNSDTTANIEQVDMSTSEDESEMESEENEKKSFLKQPTILIESKPKKIRVKSFLNQSKETISKISTENKNDTLEQVFEKISDDKSKSKQKPMSISLKQDDLLSSRMIIESEFEGFAKMAPLNKIQDTNETTIISNQEVDFNNKNNSFISQNELEKNRLKIAELKELIVFKNYEKGEPNSRLYIKNISKKAQESDLKYIYGRYINWQDETHINSFDIRLMKEGRMKGQAFVNLPDEKIAEKALNDTNGYLLDEKPLVVQFARSSKPK